MTLDLEARLWKHQGAKEAHIREVFGESATRYHQRLAGLLDDPAAVAYAPVTVHRLRRLRDARRLGRGVGRLELT